MSQKPFIWNDNNPVEWSDPSGYCIGPLAAVCAFVLVNMPEITAVAAAVLEGLAGTGGGGAVGAAERELGPAIAEFSNLRVIGKYPGYLAGEKLGMNVFNEPGLSGRALREANQNWVRQGIANRDYFVLSPGLPGQGTRSEINQLLKGGYTPIRNNQGNVIGFQPPAELAPGGVPTIEELYQQGLHSQTPP